MPTDKAHRPLGKGLSALLPPKPTPTPLEPQISPPNSAAIQDIEPNPVQPRTVFNNDRLQELADSIKANGIIQPLIVRKNGKYYQIVAGERRWRAAKLAGLTQVPIVVQEVADPHMLELALIENIQREDLNPIETAHAYERLAQELGLSHEEIGRRTGKDRSSIANMIRLLRLPTEVQILVAEHRLSMGHARALLGLESPEDQIQMAEKFAAQGLSVRQAEALVQEQAASRRPKEGSGPRREQPQDPNVRFASEELTRILGTRVRIVELSEKRGRIEIEYFSQEELERLYDLLAGKQ